MPVALIVAFAVSLGLHTAALFGLDIDLAPEPEAPAIFAELRPLPPEPLPPPVVQAPSETERKPGKVAPAKRPVVRKTEAAAGPVIMASPEPAPVPVPVPSAPVVESVSQPEPLPRAVPPAPEASPSAVSKERLPARGSIRFRVDRGDSGFEIGIARQEWEFDGERYRISSTVETTGLAWLIRSVNIEMESLGRMTDRGLQPEAFGVMREGRRARVRALFDWEAMKIRVGERSEQALDPGAQDFLSFFYQLGFLEIAPGETGTLFLATGKKYSAYRLENLGDEDIEIPLGVLRTRHLRVPGENTTELWLAYDYRLLPVKIRHIDNKGGILVQVAAEILIGN